MTKKTTLLLLAVFMFTSIQLGYSQSVDYTSRTETSNSIEDFSIYPNPVSNGKLYIVTKNNFTKQVEIYNVLGKRIFDTSLTGKELNISKIKEGIYILKVTENNITATRKLIVK